MSAITKCYADVSSAILLEHMYDIKSWLEPHLEGLQNHSFPHIFRFTLNTSGEVVMHYKDWSKSPWEPTASGIKLFKVHNIIKSNMVLIKITMLIFVAKSSIIMHV